MPFTPEFLRERGRRNHYSLGQVQIDSIKGLRDKITDGELNSDVSGMLLLKGNMEWSNMWNGLKLAPYAEVLEAMPADSNYSGEYWGAPKHGS